MFSRLCKWFNDQEQNEEGYRKAFAYLLTLKPQKHNLDDLFIHIELVVEDGRQYADVCGVNPLRANYDKSYAIEFLRWKDWVSMYITQRTLDILPEEDIVACCLYEMTYMGYDEETVIKAKENLHKTFEDLKSRV